MSMQKTDIEHALRRIPQSRLRILKLFSVSEMLSSAQLSTASGLSENALGGKVSSIVRTKVLGQPLVRPAGKDENGYVIMQLNKEVTDQKMLADVLREIGIE